MRKAVVTNFIIAIALAWLRQDTVLVCLVSYKHHWVSSESRL